MSTPVRKLWYVDPKKMERGNSEEDMPMAATDLEEPGTRQPTVLSSLSDYGMHAPVVDVDFPIRVEPSSTYGHFHLYFDGLSIEWEQYERLLRAFAEAGICSQAYVNYSIQRKQTIVRLPWVRKDGRTDPHPPIDTDQLDEEPF